MFENISEELYKWIASAGLLGIGGILIAFGRQLGKQKFLEERQNAVEVRYESFINLVNTMLESIRDSITAGFGINHEDHVNLNVAWIENAQRTAKLEEGLENHLEQEKIMIAKFKELEDTCKTIANHAGDGTPI